MSDQAAAGGGFRHVAWLYRARAEYLAGIGEFISAGAAAGEPVLVAVPASRLPPDWNPAGKTGALTIDAADLGQNPARIMPALRAFVDEYRGQRVRVVCQLAWPGRSASELGEVTRYESVVNLALASTPVRMLCPYDARLAGPVISRACSSHPWLRQDGREARSSEYRAPSESQVPPAAPLRAPRTAKTLSYEHDLRQVRALVAAEAARAGLSQPRRTDLVIAASEVAANTLKHTSGRGLVRVWLNDEEVLCQFEDSGHITDLLAGYGRPAEVAGGQGLWLVNQVCDLAEIRTSVSGTTIRLHMYRGVASRHQPAEVRASQDCVN